MKDIALIPTDGRNLIHTESDLGKCARELFRAGGDGRQGEIL